MRSMEANEKQLTSGQGRKPYQKPTLMRQQMFERFALACNKLLGACNFPAKLS